MTKRVLKTYMITSDEGVIGTTNNRVAAIGSARWNAERMADKSHNGYVEVVTKATSVVNFDVYEGTITEERK